MLDEPDKFTSKDMTLSYTMRAVASIAAAGNSYFVTVVAAIESRPKIFRSALQQGSHAASAELFDLLAYLVLAGTKFPGFTPDELLA